jgi:hypothetical protein
MDPFPKAISKTFAKSFIRSIALLLMVCVLRTQAYAAEGAGAFPNEERAPEGHASEFVYRNDPDEILIPIYLLGAVSKPGLYHVPARTDLISLLTLSGGPNNEAELQHVQIRRALPDRTFHVADVDFNKVVSEPLTPTPTLVSNDVVFIPTKQPFLSNNTIVVVGVAATVATVILTAILVGRSQ